MSSIWEICPQVAGYSVETLLLLLLPIQVVRKGRCCSSGRMACPPLGIAIVVKLAVSASSDLRLVFPWSHLLTRPLECSRVCWLATLHHRHSLSYSVYVDFGRKSLWSSWTPTRSISQNHNSVEMSILDTPKFYLREQTSVRGGWAIFVTVLLSGQQKGNQSAIFLVQNNPLLRCVHFLQLFLRYDAQCLQWIFVILIPK